jgi:uncharacterized protein involved in exopolysaccharide biosynthesis
VVIDGKEGKHYDGIVEDTLVFNPDSKGIAYMAVVGDMTPVYKASAKIIAINDTVYTVRLKIRSRHYMRDVAEKTNIANHLESIGESTDLDSVVEYLRKIVTVQLLGHNVFEISVMHSDPNIAKNIANATVNTYALMAAKWRQSELDMSAQFLAEELDRFWKRLIEVEKALLEIEEKTLLDSLDGKESDLSNSIRQLSKLKTDLLEVELDLRRAKDELKNAEKLAAGNSTEDEYSKAIIAVSYRIEALERKREKLKEKIDDYGLELHQLPQQQHKYTLLQMEKQVVENTYLMLLKRLNELTYLSSLEVSSVGRPAEILDSAELPDEPIKPGSKPYLNDRFTISGIYLVEERIE